MDQKLKQFILEFLKEKNMPLEGLEFLPIGSDGSKRSFWRIKSGTSGLSIVAMANPPKDPAARRENFAYQMIGNHLRKKGIPVPEIYRYDPRHGWFIMEDLGTSSLQHLISSNKKPIPLYEQVLEHLLRLQIEGVKEFDPSWCCQTQRYDHMVMRRYESDYFRDAFLCRYLGLKRKWPELEGPFNHLAEMGSRAEGNFFMHRDFQSRNILVSKGRICIIDWQGGRLGPLEYDLASLLIDPYVSIPHAVRDKIFQRFIILLREHGIGFVDAFINYYPYVAIQRNLQILGAFSHLTKTLNKTYFKQYIPIALEGLKKLLMDVNDPKLHSLKAVVEDLQLDK
jgi:aminoglycoside/choline kinase family phosphotransferase